MKKTGLLADIARAGSIEYQRRSCVRGTANEYVLLHELLETTSYAAMHKATHSVLSKDLTEKERNALLSFHDRLEALVDQIPWHDAGVSIEDVVEHDTAMTQIRQAATDCLRIFGVTFSFDEINFD